MAIDSSPATTAQSMLNGIDYGALIGGPLQAAIKAQAMAAQSTWEFIQHVGLNTDSEGNKSAVNVSFSYQKDGELVKLIVPILTIVPIPMIVVDDISIQFKASINASSTQSTSESTAEDISGSASGRAKIGWGPFSMSVSASASYSSKKDSKATSESKYSVEYTQDVSVHATQADMPAGLATILNILSSAATGAKKGGKLTLTPDDGVMDYNGKEVTFALKLTDSNGLNMKEADITVTGIGKDGTDITSKIGTYLKVTSGKIKMTQDITSLKTNDKGELLLTVSLSDGAQSDNLQGFVLNFEATVDDKTLTESASILVAS
ncbi:DUF2589 domain-containing protein [Spirochaeta cellobiosiphila]|uniref:DUF2589 domain-containing protein n=1 Tax=Spirochaeta cellobiosiphila TaxID=504483 RepID=UPI000409B16E|nr:DUF2589 domain-containing protein [Spirochaeta cellobiosiphila]